MQNCLVTKEVNYLNGSDHMPNLPIFPLVLSILSCRRISWRSAIAGIYSLWASMNKTRSQNHSEFEPPLLSAWWEAISLSFHGSKESEVAFTCWWLRILPLIIAKWRLQWIPSRDHCCHLRFKRESREVNCDHSMSRNWFHSILCTIMWQNNDPDNNPSYGGQPPA